MNTTVILISIVKQRKPGHA